MTHVQRPIVPGLAHRFQKFLQRRGHQVRFLHRVVAEAIVVTRHQFAALQQAFQIVNGGTAQKGSIRNQSQQWHVAPTFRIERLTQVPFGLFVLVRTTLVDNDPGNVDIGLLTIHAIQIQFVQTIAETGIGHQHHASAQPRRDAGIAGIHHAAHRHVTGTFAQDDAVVAILQDILVGSFHLGALFTEQNFAIQIILGVPLGNEHG
mmetsp:Transcript_26992/g.74459  ORF Transcript_26992/g.74459 Transcript_26992/m.74459 type:complete len:205 (+) Transcript_26992:1429-2043(+)